MLKQNMLYGSSRLGLWERNKKLTFTPVTETIQSVYRGDKRYELSDHLGNVHVVLTDRKELHCGLEDNVPFPEYYTAEVKNRYDYYPFGMLMEERKYGASVCRYDIDTSVIATVIDQNFEEDPTLDAWLYAISSATPNYGSGSMLLDYDQDPLITYWPADEGDRYKVTFSFSFEGDCDSLQVLGNVQNSTTQSYTSGGTYTFDFTVNDVSGGYGVFGFYKDNPDCIVYIHWVKIEQYTTSTQVVCDTDSVAGYRYGYNGQMKDDEVYGIEGTSYTAEFWQYDSRLGRRWNTDPVIKHHESPYATFANNPVWFSDPNGADTVMTNKDGYVTRFIKSDGALTILDHNSKVLALNDLNIDEEQVYSIVDDSKTRNFNFPQPRLFVPLSIDNVVDILNDHNVAGNRNSILYAQIWQPAWRYYKAISLGHSDYDYIFELSDNYPNKYYPAEDENDGVFRTKFMEGTGGFYRINGGSKLYCQLP